MDVGFERLQGQVRSRTSAGFGRVPGSSAPSLLRAPTPGGWLVVTDTGSAAYVPDPEGAWLQPAAFQAAYEQAIVQVYAKAGKAKAGKKLILPGATK